MVSSDSIDEYTFPRLATFNSQSASVQTWSCTLWTLWSKQDYVFPNLWTFVISFCKSCTTCMCSKSQGHKPYGFIKKLPIPEQPWNSIFMDFIKQLPDSLGYTAILVIVCRLLKQGIFIPIHDTITLADLTKLFILHVFSKHGVPSHITSDQGSFGITYIS